MVHFNYRVKAARKVVGDQRTAAHQAHRLLRVRQDQRRSALSGPAIFARSAMRSWTSAMKLSPVGMSRYFKMNAAMPVDDIPVRK
mgnify:CR=1 FL=1